MITRREFGRNVSYFAASSFLGEAFLARRSWSSVDIMHQQEMVWLDANENPAGPPISAINAIVNGASATARYHFDEFDAFATTIARSEGLVPEQVLFGVGSGELIDATICAFTSPSLPMITATPTYEIPVALAHSMGKRVVQMPLTAKWEFPVKELAEEANRAGGGLIYLCNPNNPTSSLTPRDQIAWLITNLPPNTVLLVDEAYIHFAEPEEVESAVRYVREHHPVVVTRTFSKIYGMAGARAGFCCARPDLISAIRPFQDNVIPILGLRAATAALNESTTVVKDRRASTARIRGELCKWLHQKGVAYIEPHANFVMIEVGRDVNSFRNEMFDKGVAVGRPFPSLRGMLRVTVGTDAEMKKFREVFWEVYSADSSSTRHNNPDLR